MEQLQEGVPVLRVDEKLLTGTVDILGINAQSRLPSSFTYPHSQPGAIKVKLLLGRVCMEPESLNF